jgi:hypothetical protein
MMLVALLFATLTLGSLLPADLVLRGVVRDQSGLPVPHALVYVDGTQTSTETDNTGRFELTLAVPIAGTLVVFRDGFSAASVPFDPLALEPFQIELTPAPISDIVTVTAPRRPSPPPPAFSMRPLDVVRTPGAAGDLMRALQTLPGVAQADEGAGLYVRGGDTSEVLVLLDDAVVFHPYRQETPGGGLFGSVEPFLLEGVSFATGGFSAKYGNALSAVLDMHGLRRPETKQMTVTVGLAGASMRGALPIGEHGGVRVSGNRSFPGLLFAVNGRPYEFNPLPGGWDGNVSAHYDSPGAGHLKAFVNASGDGVGVRIESLAFAGLLRSSTSSALATLHWDKVIGGAWVTAATVGVTRYVRGSNVGVKNIDIADLRASWRATAERSLGPWTIRLGGDGIDARTHIDGVVPVGSDLSDALGTDAIDIHYGDLVSGGYAEAERRWGRVTTIVGGRVQRFDLARDTTIDPRINVAIDTAPRQKMSFAWGAYHQAPDAAYYSHVAEAGLQAMRARHVVAGYEYGADNGPVHLRAEGYWKTYGGLPLESTPNQFSSDGFGNAHGLDLFARLKQRRAEITATYSWLAAQRRWTPVDDLGKYVVPASGTWAPSFDIPHTAQVLARLDVTRTLSASAGWRASSGKLDTPIAGATSTPSGFVPQYGAIDSERLPRYERTDLTLSYLSQLFASRSTVLFASVGNLLGRANFFGYAYNADYTQRRPITSATPRVVYFGITLTR